MKRAGLSPDHHFASEFFEYGKDNYWDSDKMCKHILDVVLPMFELVYPNHQAIFLFDNATNHSSYAKDALVAQGMNLNLGGKQNLMRNGYFVVEGERRSQSMVLDDGT